QTRCLLRESFLGFGYQSAVFDHLGEIPADAIPLVHFLGRPIDGNEEIGQPTLDQSLGVVTPERNTEIRIDPGRDPACTGGGDDLRQLGMEKSLAPVEDFDQEEVVADFVEQLEVPLEL